MLVPQQGHYPTIHAILQALTKFGIVDDVQELIKMADKNGDGQIDFQEFVLLMRETNKDLTAAGASGSLLRSKIPMA